MDLQIEKEEKKNINSNKSRVKVAIRVRPMIAKERIDGESVCIDIKSKKQIIIGSDRSFKFDNVFKEQSAQSQIYQQCIKQLVIGCFDGYNAAVLAYGQTGSGKTFTMGTASSSLNRQESAGIIPRVIHEIFNQVDTRKKKAEFIIKVSFLEIYNQQIIDLLADHQIKLKNKDTGISIREEKDGSVSIYGVTEETVTTSSNMLHLLEKGGFHRTTASTLMNDASSRSHAIFTIFIEQHIIQDLYTNNSEKKDNNAAEQGFMTAKFFFVDLAGSERAKKTGATGATLKEGININLGLLELGNVISALATIEKKQDQFITFRNSKLTRILQDSLGGNSNTYMIACVSPADSNYQESLNTIKYASKAMNIKNTPVINRDPQSALISQLRQKVFQLETQNRKLKQMLFQKGVNLEEQMTRETDGISEEIKKIKDQNKTIIKKYQEITNQAKDQKRKCNQLEIKHFNIKREKDILQLKFQEILKIYPQIENIQQSKDFKEKFDLNEQSMPLLEKYLLQIQSLEAQIKNKDLLYESLQKQYEKEQQNSKKDEKILIKKNNLLYTIGKENNKLKREIQKLQEKLSTGSHEQLNLSKNNQNNSITNQNYSITNENNSIGDILNEQLEQMMLLEEAETIEKDEIIQQHEQNYTQIEKQVKEEIDSVDQYIIEREKFLQKISTQQINLQTQLISEMKNQYHQKIALLEKEKKHLIKQKDQSGNQEKNKFFNKIENLETELKDYRKKIKEQKNMEKLVDNQNSKIKDLAEEIKKFKSQKSDLFKKLKEDKDNFDKLKNKRIKQLFLAKKDNLKKESQIKKLTLQNQKKSMLYRKKDDDLKRAKKINQTLKTLIKPIATTKKEISLTASTNICSSNDKISQFPADKDSKNQKQVEGKNQKQMQQLIMNSIKQMLQEIDREQSLDKYKLKMSESERQLDVLLNDDSLWKLKLEKINLKEDELSQEEQATKQELEMNINDLKERIIIAEDSINFCKNKYISVLDTQFHYFDLDTQILYHKNFSSDIEQLRILIKNLYSSLRNLLFENYKMDNEKQQRQIQISCLKENITDLRQQIMNLNSEYHQNLSQMREDMMVRYYNNIEEQQYTSPTNIKRFQEKEKKNLERKVLDLTKSNRQINQEVQMWRRKCQVVQEKYQSIRALLSKDKNIGRQEDLLPQKRIERSSTKIMERSSTKIMMDELNDMMDNIDKMKKSKSVMPALDESFDKEANKEERNSAESEHHLNRWECVGKIDAHNSSILSMALHSNILITTATKSLRIWDLQTKKIISDLSGPHLSGLVKFVMVDPDRRLIFTACDKTITIWDLITLEVQGILKSHKDEVRTIHNHNDYLFSGGKGLANSGSLLIWDLRKLNPNQALEEKQKNQDIFTFSSKDNTLFYGTRNHNVRRMNIHNFDILPPFEPPHMDSVTGLTITKNKLVSGSKDKNIRLWALDQTINHARYTLHAFNDYVTTLQGSNSSSIFYSGSRDGQVKVCCSKNDKIEVIGGLLSHTQSVNAICPLQESFYSFVTASADKTVKIWQPTKDTLENIGKEEEI